MKPAYIHISALPPSIPETHVGPFASLADASCYLANYPAGLRRVCTVSDALPLTGIVMTPDAEWLGEI